MRGHDRMFVSSYVRRDSEATTPQMAILGHAQIAFLGRLLGWP